MKRIRKRKSQVSQGIKYFKYNEDDILELLTEALAKENSYGTFYSKSKLLGTSGNDLKLIAVIGELDDDDKIQSINLEEVDKNMGFNGSH